MAQSDVYVLVSVAYKADERTRNLAMSTLYEARTQRPHLAPVAVIALCAMGCSGTTNDARDAGNGANGGGDAGAKDASADTVDASSGSQSDGEAGTGDDSAGEGAAGDASDAAEGGDATGDGGMVTCPAAMACGGALVGTWAIDTSCASFMLNSSCPQATAVTTTDSVHGTLTFNADMTYSENLALDLSVAITLPPACVQGIAGCSSLNQSNIPLSGGSGTGMLTCNSNMSGGCACTYSANPSVSNTGTYSIAGNNVTLDGNLFQFGTKVPAGYCVDGNRLRLANATNPGFFLLKQ